MNVCICYLSVCTHVLMSLLAYIFQLSYRIKSGMLVEHFIAVQNDMLYHCITILDFTENLRPGRSMKDLLVQILHYISCYKMKSNFKTPKS